MKICVAPHYDLPYNLLIITELIDVLFFSNSNLNTRFI